MAFTHTPGVFLSVESLHALLTSHIDCLECGIKKGITQEIEIVYRKVYDEDLDAGVHSLLPEAEFAGIGHDSILEFAFLAVWSPVYKLPGVRRSRGMIRPNKRTLSIKRIDIYRHLTRSRTLVTLVSHIPTAKPPSLDLRPRLPLTTQTRTISSMTNISTTIKLPSGKSLTVPTGLFINNQFVPAVDGSTIESINPATEAVICSVSAGASMSYYALAYHVLMYAIPQAARKTSISQ